MKQRVLSIFLAIALFFAEALPISAQMTAIEELNNIYRQTEFLASSYWDVFAAKSVLDDNFHTADYTVYDVTKHNKNSKWQATDYAAVILELLACNENPYDYNGRNYVRELLDYYNEHDQTWGAFANPVWAGLALEAAGADGYDSASHLGYCKAMLRDFSQGADIAGWSLIVLANHMEDDSVASAVDTFREKIKTYMITEGENTGLLDTGGMAGSITAVTTACVVSGLSAIGCDVSSPEWRVGNVSMTDALYRTSIQGKQYVNPQIAVALGDAFHGDSVFRRIAVTREKLEKLITMACALDLTIYTQDSAEAVQTTLAAAQASLLDADKTERGAFGAEYFALRDAMDSLTQKSMISLTVCTDRSVVLAPTDITYSGTLNDDIAAALEQSAIAYTYENSAFTSVADKKTDDEHEWILFVDGSPKNEPHSGSQIVLKYAPSGTQNLEMIQAADDARLLHIDGDLTQITDSLTLASSGTFGSAISWSSSLPDVITPDGTVTRQNADTNVTLTAAVTYGNAVQTRIFEVCVAKKAAISGGSVSAAKQTVRFSLRGDSVHDDPDAHQSYQTWISSTTLEIEKNDTVYDVFVRALEHYNMDFEEKSGYISAIQSPDGIWLHEFDNGKNSGWMYQVNGESPSDAMKQYEVKDGDKIEIYYVDDYTKEEYTERISSGTSAAEHTPRPTISPTPSPTPIATPTASPTPIPEKKTNIPPINEYWAYDAVSFLIERGGIHAGDDFDAGITRAEFIELLFMLSGEKGKPTNFKDISPGNSYTGAIGWAQALGIVQGDGVCFFSEKEMTRQDAAVVLCRFYRMNEIDGMAPFSDQNEIADYACGAVFALWKRKALQGVPGGLFEPTRAITRAETAQLLYKLKEYGK